MSAVVDDGEDLSNFRGVQLAGKAAKVEQADLKEELLDLALEKYFYIGHPHLEHYLSRGMIEARLWYRLFPIAFRAGTGDFCPDTGDGSGEPSRRSCERPSDLTYQQIDYTYGQPRRHCQLHQQHR